ncbi:hypothetical protein AYI69_g136 [Smittium culicis]|uniref:Clathrin light chain n=1 Tax=Smittium culicis TaxID=133412 RepID=A0A1R1YTV4_9FUNG|nr:hypothetical protein AYI69_g136 [Smittium culicis]
MADEYEKNFLKMERELLGDDADMFQSPSASKDSDFGTFESSPNTFPTSSLDNTPNTTSALNNEAFGAFDDSNLIENFKNLKSPQQSMDIEYLPKTYSQPETSEFLNDWDKKIKEVIAERDNLSEEKNKEILDKATSDLDKFYDSYNEKKKQMMLENEANQEGEYQYISSGSLWEQVSRQISLVNKSLEMQTNFNNAVNGNNSQQKDSFGYSSSPSLNNSSRAPNSAQNAIDTGFNKNDLLLSLVGDFASGLGPKTSV